MNKYPGVCNPTRTFFHIAGDRLSSPFEYPDPKKQVVIVSDNYKLLVALSDIAEKENAQLRHARPGTPDVLVFSGAVKIIDRSYLGTEAWETFCDYLERVNEETKFPQCDEQGEIIFEEPVYDYTPLIIVDSDLDNSRSIFKEPSKARGGVYYIEQYSVELIVQLTCRLLRESTSGICMVKAEKEVEGRRIDTQV